MCNLSEWLVDRVTKEVTDKVNIEMTRNLMQTTGWTMEQALDALMIPEMLRRPVRKALAH